MSFLDGLIHHVEQILRSPAIRIELSEQEQSMEARLEPERRNSWRAQEAHFVERVHIHRRWLEHASAFDWRWLCVHDPRVNRRSQSKSQLEYLGNGKILQKS